MNDQHAGLVNWSHSIGLCFCPSCKKKKKKKSIIHILSDSVFTVLTRHTAISHSLHGETQSHTALTPKLNSCLSYSIIVPLKCLSRSSFMITPCQTEEIKKAYNEWSQLYVSWRKSLLLMWESACGIIHYHQSSFLEMLLPHFVLGETVYTERPHLPIRGVCAVFVLLFLAFIRCWQCCVHKHSANGAGVALIRV